MAARFKPCSIDGCKGNAHHEAKGARGLCSSHYKKLRKYGNPLEDRTKPRFCSISGCERKHYGLGLCVAHWERQRRHGDPLGGNTAFGDPERFYRSVVLPYDGNECLTWPFATNGTGYAQLTVDGEHRLVSRMLCEEMFGPAPSAEHEAAHSCGRGGFGCVTKDHLRWATPSENQMDRVQHGTSNRGERQGRAKLTESEVREILALKGKMSHRQIAALYNVSRENISLILRRVNWAWLD